MLETFILNGNSTNRVVKYTCFLKIIMDGAIQDRGCYVCLCILRKDRLSNVREKDLYVLNMIYYKVSCKTLNGLDLYIQTHVN